MQNTRRVRNTNACYWNFLPRDQMVSFFSTTVCKIHRSLQPYEKLQDKSFIWQRKWLVRSLKKIARKLPSQFPCLHYLKHSSPISILSILSSWYFEPLIWFVNDWVTSSNSIFLKVPKMSRIVWCDFRQN